MQLERMCKGPGCLQSSQMARGPTGQVGGLDIQGYGPRGAPRVPVSIRSIILPMGSKQFCSVKRAARASLGRVPVLLCDHPGLGRHAPGNFMENSPASMWSDLGSSTVLATPPSYSQGWVDHFQRGPFLSFLGFLY